MKILWNAIDKCALQLRFTYILVLLITFIPVFLELKWIMSPAEYINIIHSSLVLFLVKETCESRLVRLNSR